MTTTHKERQAQAAAPASDPAAGDSIPGGFPPLAIKPRFLLLIAGWGLYLLGGPGVITTGGSALGLLGFAFWAAAVSRPGPRAKLVEYLCASAFLGLQLTWIGYVFWPTLPYIFLGAGAYGLLGGALLRKLTRIMPLGLAAGLGWIGAETLRAVVPPPFGMGWLRAGHYFHTVPDWLGSARVWGVVGLGFCGVAAAGALAEIWMARRGVLKLRWGWRGLLLACLPLLLAPLIARVVPAPTTQPGPRVLLVQPGFEQKRKQGGNPFENFVAQLELTAQGLAGLDRPPELVCWGETMLDIPLIEPELAARVRAAEAAGDLTPFEIAPWWGLGQDPLVRWIDQFERLIVDRVDYGVFRSTLPEGTAFLSGAERYVEHEGQLRRQNTIALWGPDGELAGISEKQHLAPGGETMLGAERFQIVRDVIHDLANYVPDFLAGERTSVLPLVTAQGDRYAIAATACFDNAFVDVYLDPVAREPVDFHVIVSNEAWFQRSQEYDQMLAFSRCAAVMSGRTLVRATNGGVSAAYDPDGTELARLSVDGEDRLVKGTLLVEVPVPAAGEGVPPFARSFDAWRYGACLLAFLLAGIGAARNRYSARDKG
jgi:apolipoprotein N-acyltransferase